MSDVTQYSELNPRETAKHVVATLKRLRPQLGLSRFSQMTVLARKMTDVVKWVRYRKIANAGVLGEGIAPNGKKLQSDTVSAKVEQIGDAIYFTDVALDLHPDDLITEARDVVDEQILDTMEAIYYDVIRGGTLKAFAAGAANRAATTGVVTGADLRKALLTLKKSDAMPITSILDGGIGFNTTPVEACFIGYTNPSLEPVLRDIVGFETCDKYSKQTTLFPGEFGKFENCRLLTSTIANPNDSLLGAGGIVGDSIAHTVVGGDKKADIHQIIFFGKGAYGGIPFGGPNSLKMYVRTPSSTVGDPVAQQAYVAWKARFNAALLQQKALNRLETAIPA
mgnify:FL=1